MGFTELVGNIGFYGACLVALAMWVDKQIKNHREDTQKTIEMLREDAKENLRKNVLNNTVNSDGQPVENINNEIKSLQAKSDAKTGNPSTK